MFATETDALDAEDLACLGFRRERDWFRETFADLLAKPVPAPVPTARRQRRPNIAAMVKQAQEAGRVVTSATVEGNRVVLTFGEGESVPDNEVENWFSKQRRHADQR